MIPRVVIIGAGFGGLWAARGFRGVDVDVLVIDRNNYHTFLPLLYQVAAAELEPEGIAYPVRSILKDMDNASFLMAEVSSIDVKNKIVSAGDISIPYDYLILSPGSTTNYFGIQGARNYTYPLKTLEHAMDIRNQILRSFELSLHEPSAEARRAMLTFVIVGGGATGIELAGAVAELAYGPFKSDYRGLDFNEVKVIIIEAGGSLVNMFAPELREYAKKRLESMGVVVRLDTAVKEITDGAVVLGSGEIIYSKTIVWTAGVSGAGLSIAPGLTGAASQRIKVMPDLTAEGYPDIYVIGDVTYLEHNERPLPMVAPVAVQQGKLAAGNILRRIAGVKQEKFVYNDRGSMVTIGRNAAVAQIGTAKFTGFIAWLLWLFVHLRELIGFKNRILVLMDWAQDYLFFERAVRLILPLRRRVASDRVRA